ncbi:MAG: hypothetical protein Q9159_001417 [Coniocarpon cinnabarinum]
MPLLDILLQDLIHHLMLLDHAQTLKHLTLDVKPVHASASARDVLDVESTRFEGLRELVEDLAFGVVEIGWSFDPESSSSGQMAEKRVDRMIVRGSIVRDAEASGRESERAKGVVHCKAVYRSDDRSKRGARCLFEAVKQVSRGSRS